MNRTRKIAFLSIFLAFAILINLIERRLPSPIPLIPGIKLGLSNAVVLVTLYVFGAGDALLLSLLKIFAGALLFFGPFGAIYSLFGALLSFLFMTIFKNANIFGIVGVSVVGGVFHNFGQLCAAAIVVETPKLYYYLPMLIISGIIAGVIVGIVSGFLIIRLKKIF